jgi:hypothetical protein
MTGYNMVATKREMGGAWWKKNSAQGVFSSFHAFSKLTRVFRSKKLRPQARMHAPTKQKTENLVLLQKFNVSVVNLTVAENYKI